MYAITLWPTRFKWLICTVLCPPHDHQKFCQTTQRSYIHTKIFVEVMIQKTIGYRPSTMNTQRLRPITYIAHTTRYNLTVSCSQRTKCSLVNLSVTGSTVRFLLKLLNDYLPCQGELCNSMIPGWGCVVRQGETYLRLDFLQFDIDWGQECHEFTIH